MIPSAVQLIFITFVRILLDRILQSKAHWHSSTRTLTYAVP